MANHPNRYRGNTIFRLDGHTGDWLVNNGELRLREEKSGRWRSVEVIGSTHPREGGGMRSLTGLALHRTYTLKPTNNTPKELQALVGKRFTTMKAARAAVIEAILGSPRENILANNKLLVAAGYPSYLFGMARKLALKKARGGTLSQTEASRLSSFFAMKSDE